MRYPTLLFDLDHTLLDSDASEVAAFSETVRGVGMEPTDELFQQYRAINKTLWTAVERGETTPVEVRLTRFERFVAAAGIDAGPAEMAEAFTAGLGANGELYPGTEAVLDQLVGQARMAMVTNGLSEVQRARIERLDLGSYFEVVIVSAEVGTAKPGTAIFDLAFEQLGHPDRAGSLMIGDSLTSDIQGGANFGIDTCWYNPSANGTERPKRIGTEPSGPESISPSPITTEPVATHAIAALDQLPPLVFG